MTKTMQALYEVVEFWNEKGHLSGTPLKYNKYGRPQARCKQAWDQLVEQGLIVEVPYTSDKGSGWATSDWQTRFPGLYAVVNHCACNERVKLQHKITELQAQLAKLNKFLGA